MRGYLGIAGESDQTARRARPRLRRERMTRRPVWLRIRTRKPDTRLRLRLVPSRVRLVMAPARLRLQRRLPNLPARLVSIALGIDLDEPTAQIAGNGYVAGSLR